MEIRIIEILLCIRMYTTHYIVWVSHLLWVDFQTMVPILAVQSTGLMMTQMQQPVNKKGNHISNCLTHFSISCTIVQFGHRQSVNISNTA